MKKSDLIEILTEIESLILTSRQFIRNEDELDGGHYIIDPDDLRRAISQRVKELSYDEWAG